MSSPLDGAEPIACWLERFAADAKFRAVVVVDQGEFLAALPLVDFSPRRWVHAGGITGNEWSGSGGLLLDQGMAASAADTARIMRLMVRGLQRLDWPLVWIEEAPLDSPAWQALSAAVRRQGIPALRLVNYEVNEIDLSPGWEKYSERLSKNARKQLRRDERRLAEFGKVDYVWWRFRPHEAAAELPVVLRAMFRVEDRGWKGNAQTSVLATEGMFEFFLNSVRAVAALAEFQIHALTLDGEPIAFQLAYLAHGVFHVHKIGYDQKYSACSPGHLLRQRVLETLCAEQLAETVDCLGPRNPASDRWATGTHRIGRLILAPHGVRGRLILWGYRALRPGVRLLRSLRSPGGVGSATTKSAEADAGPGAA